MKTILAIDDQKDNLTTIEAVLKSYITGCRVLTALSGPEGIIAARQAQPDTIILDIIMPGMDGYEVCEKLKSDELTRHIPVIMLTAIKTDSQSRVKGLDAGADAFLSKPIDPVEFSAQINVMLRIKEAEDKLREEKEVLEKLVLDRTAKLRESEEKYKSLYDNAPLPYQSLNEDGSFKDVNPAWLRTLGYDRDEVIGKNYADFLHPDWKAHFEKNFPAFKKRGYVHDVEFKIRHKDGHYSDIAFEGCIGYYPDGSFKQTYCVFQDITDRKQAELAVRVSRDQYKSLFNQIADPVLVFDQESKMILDCNTAMIDKYGYTIDELSGMTPVGLHPADEDTERVKRNIEDKEQTSPNEYLHRGKDGTIYFVETHTQDIFYKGREAWITIIRDVTERKKAEHDLKTAFEKATESDRLKSAFLANMSHEIRTPMNGILGFADLLKEPGLTGEQQKKYIAIIENSGDRMLNTINNLIDISKVEAGQMEVSLSEVNVNEQI